MALGPGDLGHTPFRCTAFSGALLARGDRPPHPLARRPGSWALPLCCWHLCKAARKKKIRNRWHRCPRCHHPSVPLPWTMVRIGFLKKNITFFECHRGNFCVVFFLVCAQGPSFPFSPCPFLLISWGATLPLLQCRGGEGKGYNNPPTTTF